MEKLLETIIQKIRKFFLEKLHYRAEDLPFYLTIVFAFVLFVLAINVFAELTEELVEDDLTAFDNAGTKLILSTRQDWLTPIMIFITNVGTRTGYFIVVALLVVYFVLRHRSWKFIVETVAVLLIASSVNLMLKEIIHRPRPSIEHLVTVYTLSYPSGHAMSAVSFYGFLIFLSFRYKMSTSLRVVIVITLSLLIICIGISRVYLGVHYPSDVLAGFIGGLIWVAFCVIVFDVINLNNKRKKRMIETHDLIQ